MTDTFLDDQQVHDLAHHCTEIARLLPEALRIARRETSPPGGRAARNPNTPSSQPPLNLGALDLHNDVTYLLTTWTSSLADHAHIGPPPNTDGPTLARHLARNAHIIAQQYWAKACADELKRCHNQLRFVDGPPDAKYIGPCQSAGPAQCRGLFRGDGRNGYCDRCDTTFDVAAVQAATEERKLYATRDTNGTPAELSQFLRQAGVKVTRKQITYWARRKWLVQRGEVAIGERTYPLYNLGEVESVFYRLNPKDAVQRVE